MRKEKKKKHRLQDFIISHDFYCGQSHYAMTPLFTFELADGKYIHEKREGGAKLKTQDLHYT
jgi:hypothetical protein